MKRQAFAYYTLEHEDGTKEAARVENGNGSLGDMYRLALSLLQDGVDPETVMVTEGVPMDHPILNNGGAKHVATEQDRKPRA